MNHGAYVAEKDWWTDELMMELNALYGFLLNMFWLLNAINELEMLEWMGIVFVTLKAISTTKVNQCVQSIQFPYW